MCCSALAQATSAPAPYRILLPIKVPTSLYSSASLTAQRWVKNREQLDVFRINCSWITFPFWLSPPLYSLFPPLYLSTSVHSLCKYSPFTLHVCDLLLCCPFACHLLRLLHGGQNFGYINTCCGLFCWHCCWAVNQRRSSLVKWPPCCATTRPFRQYFTLVNMLWCTTSSHRDHRCFIQCSCCLKSAVGNQTFNMWPTFVKFSLHIWVWGLLPHLYLYHHHCPLWSPCGLQLHCPPLRYLLTVCFLSQQAPSSLLEALEQHLASLEGKKVKDSTAASRYVNPAIIFSISLISIRNLRGCIFFCNAGKNKNVLPYRASTLSNAVSSLASTGMSFTKVDEREKQAALEEEQARLKALKVL